MSYTPENQEIDEPVSNLLDAIHAFREVSNNRRHDSEWSEEHIIELVDIEKKLLDIELHLRKI